MENSWPMTIHGVVVDDPTRIDDATLDRRTQALRLMLRGTQPPHSSTTTLSQIAIAMSGFAGLMLQWAGAPMWMLWVALGCTVAMIVLAVWVALQQAMSQPYREHRAIRRALNSYVNETTRRAEAHDDRRMRQR